MVYPLGLPVEFRRIHPPYGLQRHAVALQQRRLRLQRQRVQAEARGQAEAEGEGKRPVLQPSQPGVDGILMSFNWILMSFNGILMRFNVSYCCFCRVE